ncbi:MAG: hypothetical protein K8R88_03360, partial [Armatimonadetes bacterium]|nr:hypothetical protein [Armatimonadota bacterium]
TVSVASGATNPVPGIVGSAGTAVGNGKAYAFFAGKILALGGPVPVPINYAAQTQIDSRAEELALFDEITWALERMYYNPKLNNKDWAGLRKKYLSIIPYTTDRTDFYALMSEFVEELESSHQGATAPAVARADGAEVTGWLGIEWNWAELAGGKYVVGKVGEGTPADLPASRLLVGDQVLTVDGKTLGAASPLGVMLKNKTGSKVRLGVKRGGKDIEVVIKPTSPLVATRTRYDDWVKWNREQVEKLSGGKLTYHHIQGMDEPSYQKFLREMRTLTNGKKGVVIDVRYNGGGSTSHKILGVLIKTPWMYRTLRTLGDMKISENIYRGDTLELPSALMTNQYSFSNAEIMSEGFRQLKIGPVIGERTAGGVIGTSAHGLWDGGQIRMPAIGCYAVNGENLEGNGRKPDFNVAFDPNIWNQGRDPQLEKAVEELLRKVK